MKLTSKKLKELILESYMTYLDVDPEKLITAKPYFSEEDARDYAEDLVASFKKSYGHFPDKTEFHQHGQAQGPVDETLLAAYEAIAQSREQK